MRDRPRAVSCYVVDVGCWPSAEKGRRHVGCLPETAQAARVECALDFTPCALVSAQVLRTACTDKIGCLLLQTMRTRGPARGRSYCDPERTSPFARAPINVMRSYRAAFDP